MYRAQRLAEFALYDSDPRLFDSELDHYLSVTANDIRNAVAHYIDVENRVVLDIIPAAAEKVEEEASFSFATAARRSPSTCCTAPQIPEVPAAEPERIHLTLNPSASERQNDPADAQSQTKPGSGPLHV